jgi:AAA family ATP:ADP antiporter
VTVLRRSPYLLGIGFFVLLTGVVSTFLYFTELRIVESAAESVERRTSVFASINVWTQVATLVAQAFVAGRIMRFVGVGSALATLPLFSAGGFALLGAAPTLAVYTTIAALHKAIQHGITRPARETLFTVVSREDKYKAKPFLDIFAFRAGDAAGAQLESSLVASALGMTGLAAGVLPIALIWTALSLTLGIGQSRRAGR